MHILAHVNNLIPSIVQIAYGFPFSYKFIWFPRFVVVLLLYILFLAACQRTRYAVERERTFRPGPNAKEKHREGYDNKKKKIGSLLPGHRTMPILTLVSETPWSSLYTTNTTSFFLYFFLFRFAFTPALYIKYIQWNWKHWFYTLFASLVCRFVLFRSFFTFIFLFGLLVCELLLEGMKKSLQTVHYS